jgi:hypothetical protein
MIGRATEVRPLGHSGLTRQGRSRLPRAVQKSACSLAASSSSIGPTTSVGEPAGEHDFAGQIEGWLFLLASGLVLERVLGAVSITFRPISAAKAWSYGWNIRRANGSLTECGGAIAFRR